MVAPALPDDTAPVVPMTIPTLAPPVQLRTTLYNNINTGLRSDWLETSVAKEVELVTLHPCHTRVCTFLMEKLDSAPTTDNTQSTSRVAKKKVLRKAKGIAAAASQIAEAVSAAITESPITTGTPTLYPHIIMNTINWHNIVAIV